MEELIKAVREIGVLAFTLRMKAEMEFEKAGGLEWLKSKQKNPVKEELGALPAAKKTTAPKAAAPAPAPKAAEPETKVAEGSLGEKEALDQAYKLTANYLDVKVDSGEDREKVTEDLRAELKELWGVKNIKGMTHPKLLEFIPFIEQKLKGAVQVPEAGL